MKAAFTAAWWTVSAIWILSCVLVGRLAEPSPDTGEATWWLAILTMAAVLPFAVYALGLGLGQMFHPALGRLRRDGTK